MVRQARVGGDQFIKDGLAYLYHCRMLWFPQRQQSVTAQAQPNGKYSLVAVPADCGIIDAITCENEPLVPITTEEYLANLRPESEGGGTYLTDLTGDPAKFLVVVAGESAQFAVQILPEQAAAFTLTFFYRASGQGLSADADTILLPIALHPLLVVYTNYRWRLDDGDIRGAAMLRSHHHDLLEEISFIPPATGVLPVIHSTLPSETATRRS